MAYLRPQVIVTVQKSRQKKKAPRLESLASCGHSYPRANFQTCYPASVRRNLAIELAQGANSVGVVRIILYSLAWGGDGVNCRGNQIHN
jgi:hypothetical protein